MMRQAQAQRAEGSGRPALLQAMIDAMRIPDLRYRILFTLAILVLFRFIAHVPVPGVDRAALDAAFDANPFLGILDLFSGGALRNLSVAALGVYPYITASIILQILTPIIPSLKALSQEGEAGRKTINRYTHYMTVPLALLQGYGQINLFSGSFGDGAISGIGFTGDDLLNTVSILVAMTAGTMFLVWLGELVTEKGIGNGLSLIIFAGIVSTLPQVVGQLWLLRDQPFQVMMLLGIGLVIVYLIVYFNEAQRRVPVQYGRSVFRGGRMYRQSGASHLPLRVNAAGMIPLIFAFSLITLPTVLASFFLDPRSDSLLAQTAQWFTSNLGPTSTPYWVAIFLMVVVFTFFYTLVTHSQQNLAENLQKNGGFIPGIRPGQPTRDYLMRVVLRITWGGALFLGMIAIMPWIAGLITNLDAATSIVQSTSLLIMVGVALDTMRQLEAQLLMRNYEGFIR
ncbi:MAG: preprotein translocase subunit SecY [Chloroflexi bacterium]|nr:preprotein translocase subunit SecY [Chloroflexota bacterium]MDA1296450.1 preprotein translocase subunit SecY [Chloroflexota bacterium]